MNDHILQECERCTEQECWVSCSLDTIATLINYVRRPSEAGPVAEPLTLANASHKLRLSLNYLAMHQLSQSLGAGESIESQSL